MRAKRLVLVDDHGPLLDHVTMLLAEAPGIAVVGRYTTGIEAVNCIKVEQPDVALIDLELPDIPGVEIIRRVRAFECSTACIVLTHFDDDTHLFPAMQAGAVGYVLKAPTRSGLLKAIQDVLDGEIHMSARLARRIFQTMREPSKVLSPEIESLTQRECQILEALGRGDSTRQVAKDLGIAYETIRAHLRHIYTKLEVRSRYEALKVFRGEKS